MPYQQTIPYADLPYAIAYFGDRLNTDAWDGSTAQKQLAALKMSTRAIDNLNFAGGKHDDSWLVAPPSLPAAPVLTPGSGGSLSAGNYSVALSLCYGTPTLNVAPPFVSGAESLLGAASNATVGAAGSIQVAASIQLPTGACGIAIYVKPPSNPSYFLAAFVPSGTVNVTALTYLANAFASAGTGQTLPCANQPNQFPRGDDVAVPDPIAQACCELALALLDDVDPNIEIENLQNKMQSIDGGRTERDTSYVQEHVRAGIPSIQAWMLLVPFLRDTQHPRMHLERAN